jgi:hypothetical protein
VADNIVGAGATGALYRLTGLDDLDESGPYVASGMP